MTTLTIICMWCQSFMGRKDGGGTEGKTSSICKTCWQKRFPNIEYPKENDAEK